MLVARCMFFNLSTRYSRLPSGDKVVILYDKNTEKPLLLPLLYSSLHIYKLAFSTQKSYIRGVKLFYLFWQEKFNINFDSYLHKSGFDLDFVCSHLTGFSIWLSAVTTENSINVKMASVHLYLQWVVDRYFTTRYLECDLKDISILSSRTLHKLEVQVRSIGRGYGRNGNNNVFSEFNSLHYQAEIAARTIIRPSTLKTKNTQNPWNGVHNQVRNYLMVILMLDYGLRIGEVLNLTTLSVIPNIDGSAHYILLTEVEQHPNKNEPNHKNKYSRRRIKISNDFADILYGYIDNLRPLPSPAHDILFVASGPHARALSVSAPRDIVNGIYRQISRIFPEIVSSASIDCLVKLTPHVFRHTWAVNTLFHLIEIEKYDMDKALEMLTQMGGWSINSRVPIRYASRCISNIANAKNIERIALDERRFISSNYAQFS